MWLCPTTENEREKWICARAQYCGWTNNPTLFDRDWWLSEMRPTIAAIGPHVDLEYFLNWNKFGWAPRLYIVALGEGLFSHHEINEHARVNHVPPWKQKKN